MSTNTGTMTMPPRLPLAVRFFWKHACFSYKPGEQTPEQGRLLCAQNLAAAEGIAREAGYTYEWSVSDIDSSNWSDERPAWPQYDCLMRDVNGDAVQSLHGCDFGKDASGPYGDYRRVVEAELAVQECDEVLRQAVRS